MNSYKIELKKKYEIYSENFSALSFPEAVTRAYLIRNKKGYDWKVTSVSKEC